MKYLVISLLIAQAALSNPLNTDSMRYAFYDGEIASAVSNAIRRVRPSLPKEKVWSYAKAIAVASETYQVDPFTLVAIAYQESSFRENLPEGKAGEIGMLQIRKIWLKHSKFRKAFKGATVQDLNTPEKAFVFAAWILNGLKQSSCKKKLPYWTYYNARKFNNRFTYYLRVKRHLSSIESSRQARERLLLAQTTQWQPEPFRKLNETDSPTNLLETIDWHKKAIEVLKERKS